MFSHNDYYKEIELNFDKDALIEENEEINYHPFSSGKKRNSFSDLIPNWLQGPVTNDIIYEYFEVKRIKDIKSARSKNLFTVPTKLGVEKKTNPFLRPFDKNIRNKLNMLGSTDIEVFSKIRSLKDNF